MRPFSAGPSLEATVLISKKTAICRGGTKPRVDQIAQFAEINQALDICIREAEVERGF